MAGRGPFDGWRRRAPLALVAALLVTAGACTPREEPPGPRPPATLPPFAGEIAVTVPDADRCELFTDECLAPFPSDRFTRSDVGAHTKRRVDLKAASMPTNTSGKAIDPAEWNRNDGFSPGTPIVTKVDGLDLERSGAPSLLEPSRSLAPDSPVVVLDATTGKRVTVYAELDDQAHLDQAKAGPDRRALIIRPEVNFPDGHRIVVALRNLKRADGSVIPPSDAFRAYRDRLNTNVPVLEERRLPMEEVFADLAAAGVGRDDLHLAWDFTVASTRNLTERALHLRDDAFATLAGGAPRFTVTTVTEAPAAGVRRHVEGTLEVPNYLTDDGRPGSVLANDGDPNGIPRRTGTYTANVLCVVPDRAVAEPGNNIGIVYGHGLLGSANEVRGVGARVGSVTTPGNAVVCATDEIGMATRDVPAIAGTLGDFSTFRSLPDRLQQGLLNELFLGRALKHPAGLASHPAFRSDDGRPLLSGDVAYKGHSQGGILGGAASALAQDWTRAFLGVPAMNYSTLLNRSVDFDGYAVLMRNAYPDPFDQQVIFALLQMLWDRGETNGYAAHITTDPLPGTPVKQVFLFQVFGDHQVSNYAANVMGRTVGAKVREPALAPGRWPLREAFAGMAPLTATGAVKEPAIMVMWDFGTPAPPVGNVPNRGGSDPHGAGRRLPEVAAMTLRWLRSGEFVDPCPTGQPCRTAAG